jgi:hypothetical protein
MEKASLRRLLAVALYAVAMAWVEAAVVFYLRSMMPSFDPYQPNPLPDLKGLGHAELIREAATLIMLGTVGWLAGNTRRNRFGYAAMAFGIWDLFYYVFLIPLTGWPHSVFDWDILFLLPLPWWGPVLAPVLIACLLVLGGGLLAWYDTASRPVWPTRWSVACAAMGALLALGVFMADALRVASQGVEALRHMLPTSFGWGGFWVALALMAVPVVDLGRQVRRLGNERRTSEAGREVSYE